MTYTDRALAVLAVVALGSVLGAPLAAADGGSMETTGIQGDAEVNVSATAPTMLLRDASLAGTVELEGEHVTVERVDDWREVVRAKTPTGSQELLSNNHRNRTIHHHDGLETARVLGFNEPNATVLVTPLEPDVDLSTTHQGSFAVKPTEDRVLERSHFIQPVNGTDSKLYYEYKTRQKVSMAFDGASTAEVTGSFEVYLWGASAEIIANESASYETGHFVEERSQGTQTVTEDHYVFARLRVTQGTLTMDVERPRQMVAFADTFRADPGADAELTFLDANGTLPGPSSSYRSEGDTLSARDGAYRWTYDGDRVATATVEAPADVEGGQPVNADDETPVWPWLAAGLAAVGLVAVGQPVDRHADRARAWLRERRVDRWMQAGDRMTSVRDYEAAHKYYARVTETYPEISEAWYSRGIVLQELDRHDDAAEAFVQAHETINEDEPELVDMAAAEAWRAGEEAKARELFEQLAVLDPIRLRRRTQEPGFEDLRSRGWMRDLLDTDDTTGVQYA